MTRAVTYSRYSSDLQSSASIADQVHRCKARIEAEGWQLVETYSDSAVSGASMLRPGLQALLEAAHAGRFEVLVTEALDRLSRDLSDVAQLYKDLSFRGIRIVTLAEGEIGELHVGLKGTMNQLYLKDLADKTRRGLEGRVRQGRSGGGNAYGYDVISETNADGTAARGLRRINPAEAAVVRRIHEDFAAGKSPIAIARALNAEGVPGPRGRAWRDTAIRGHRHRGTGILNNELYIGRLVWNRLRYVKDPASGRRVSRANPPDLWVVEEVPELRIVSEALWQAVKARQDAITGSPRVEKARATRFWERRRARHLLTGKVFCGSCGGALASVGRDYLGCNRARKQGTCSNGRTIRRAGVESEVLRLLQEQLMQPVYVEAFVAAFNEEMARLAGAEGAAEAARRRQLAGLTRKLEGLYDAIAEGLRTPGLKARLDELEARKAELEQALVAPAEETPVRLHPNLAEVYRAKIENLRAELADPEIRAEAMPLIHELIDRVVATPQGPTRKDGWEIDITGDIVRLVAFSNSAKGTYDKAVLSGRTACSVKVVAGAGFEPATFRL